MYRGIGSPERKFNLGSFFRLGMLLVAGTLIASCAPIPVQTMATSEAIYHERETEIARIKTKIATPGTPTAEVPGIVRTALANMELKATREAENFRCVTGWETFDSSLSPKRNLAAGLARFNVNPDKDCDLNSQIVVGKLRARSNNPKNPMWYEDARLAEWCYKDILAEKEMPENFWASTIANQNDLTDPGNIFYGFKFTGQLCPEMP